MGVSHEILARWYRQLAQHLTAGLTFSDALLAAEGPPAEDRGRLRDRLLQGDSVDFVLADAPKWMPQLDRLLLSAGQEAGRLPDVLNRLSLRHEQTRRNVKRAVGALVYPVLVLNLAVLCGPALKLANGDVAGYVEAVLRWLVPLWVVIVVVALGLSNRLPSVGHLVGFLPGLRGYRRRRALADFCFTLDAFLSAGCGMDVSWFGAGEAAGTPAFRREGMRMAERVQAGQAPSGFLADSGLFPEDFIQLYTSGEKTGALDLNLQYLSGNYRDEADRRLSAAASWYPKLVFGIAAVVVAWHVVSYYSNYLNSILSLAH